MIELVHPESLEILSTLLQNPRVIYELGRLSTHVPRQMDYGLNVGSISVDLGIDNGFSDEDLIILGYAGLLHDLGKLKVPKEVLLKGLLTPEDWEIIRRHPREGFVMLESFKYDGVRQIIVGHHEYRPNPYPRSGMDRRSVPRNTPDRRITNKRIVASTQIVAVVDMFDALVNGRHYLPKLPPEEAGRILREQFNGDPKYLDQLLQRRVTD